MVLEGQFGHILDPRRGGGMKASNKKFLCQNYDILVRYCCFIFKKNMFTDSKKYLNGCNNIYFTQQGDSIKVDNIC